MIRVPFELVRQKVESLYDDPTITSDAAAEAQVKFISDFIQGAGWSEDQYFDELFRRSEDLTSATGDLSCQQRLASMN